jgi:hypothetical protein
MSTERVLEILQGWECPGQTTLEGLPERHVTRAAMPEPEPCAEQESLF